MIKMLGMCFNWKVAAWLAAAGAGLFLIAPNLGLAVVPILVAAACPISMLLMGRAMMGGHGGPTEPQLPKSTGEPADKEEQLSQLRGQLQTLQEMEAALVKRVAE